MIWVTGKRENRAQLGGSRLSWWGWLQALSRTWYFTKNVETESTGHMGTLPVSDSHRCSQLRPVDLGFSSPGFKSCYAGQETAFWNLHFLLCSLPCVAMVTWWAQQCFVVWHRQGPEVKCLSWIFSPASLPRPLATPRLFAPEEPVEETAVGELLTVSCSREGEQLLSAPERLKRGHGLGLWHCGYCLYHAPLGMNPPCGRAGRKPWQMIQLSPYGTDGKAEAREGKRLTHRHTVSDLETPGLGV